MKRNHLSLVSSHSPPESSGVAIKDTPRVDNTMTPFGFQLTLPFEEETLTTQIIVVAMDQVHGIQLCNLILEAKPRKAIDLRHLIRFDLHGTNRAEIFRHFEKANTTYIRAPLPWHHLQPNNFISDDALLSQQFLPESVEREERPILFLTSKKTEVRYLISHLHRVLSMGARRPWRIEEVG